MSEWGYMLDMLYETVTLTERILKSIYMTTVLDPSETTEIK